MSKRCVLILLSRIWLLQGGAATKRAQYEAKWHTFVTSKEDRNIRYDAVPWLAI